MMMLMSTSASSSSSSSHHISLSERFNFGTSSSRKRLDVAGFQHDNDDDDELKQIGERNNIIPRHSLMDDPSINRKRNLIDRYMTVRDLTLLTIYISLLNNPLNKQLETGIDRYLPLERKASKNTFLSKFSKRRKDQGVSKTRIKRRV